MANAGQEIFIAEDPGIGKIYLLNVKEKEVNQECLKEKIKNVIYCIDNEKIAPYKVEIWEAHPLVQDALKAKSVRIERSGSSRNVLIPLKSKGKVIILYQDKFYAMYAATSDKLNMNFEECIK
ncbi:MAG: hypothetical protein WCY05_07595 [Candidatus Omnitrophota bacterium]